MKSHSAHSLGEPGAAHFVADIYFLTLRRARGLCTPRVLSPEGGLGSERADSSLYFPVSVGFGGKPGLFYN